MTETSGGPLRLVCFDLGDQELALPIADVGETLPLHPITPVFLTPPCLAGVFSLRGDIVPVIDLGVLLGLHATRVGADSKIVVIDCDDTTIGVVVDRLRDLRTIDGALEPPPPGLPAHVAALFAGVSVTQTGSVRVLSAHAIVNAEALRALAARTTQGEA